MIRAIILSLICAVCIGGIAYAGARPESLEELTYNLNTVLNEELDERAFLNGRLIVHVERVSTCVSAVWTRSGDVGSPLRRDLLEWNKMFDGDPRIEAQSYYLTFVYTDHRSDDVVSMPLTAHPDRFEDTAGVYLPSCQPKRHHRK
ncbi:hypothetical protein LU298_05585 [Komagataeibacter intermedius]|uniref:Uncharacterized protein n=3 Tax=Komagataeibacter intermedius TaxID=66229 RepID=A0A0C1V4X3_9PROT|nr:hypothetical protein [Komagataeibacter intermedius]GAN87660.1 hypothetical protein Gain_0075_011 [Komagataeibacter intermedius TF2]KPH88008.1 hypothetical protein GLUCOINTEAF2_0201938 [Komagataeibacter intermedius AF2]KPH88013.1 hypothetical protein GLUCOINTEAF2_0204003 [Komagataeibacter intermedius AF2]MCF3635971.1 hypothetical protein [Komagataeibacter intermedius]GBQ71186.1 hypothetical protein AA0521_1855 [Komagataeibacter intermedius NRIC 0521]